jgi:hypothetical protein
VASGKDYWLFAIGYSHKTQKEVSVMKVSALLVKELKREVVFQLRRVEQEMAVRNGDGKQWKGLRQSHRRFKALLTLLEGLEHDGELIISPEPIVTENPAPQKPEPKYLVDDLYCVDECPMPNGRMSNESMTNEPMSNGQMVNGHCAIGHCAIGHSSIGHWSFLHWASSLWRRFVHLLGFDNEPWGGESDDRR